MEDVMAEVFDTYGEEGGTYEVFVEKQWYGPLGRPWLTWDYNIKMDWKN